jgi:hypothetical protein
VALCHKTASQAALLNDEQYNMYQLLNDEQYDHKTASQAALLNDEQYNNFNCSMRAA